MSNYFDIQYAYVSVRVFSGRKWKLDFTDINLLQEMCKFNDGISPAYKTLIEYENILCWP